MLFLNKWRIKMAVKVHNTESLRKSKRWNEKDDAALCLLVKRKIRDVDVALRESESPYERSRLKSTKSHYRQTVSYTHLRAHET